MKLLKKILQIEEDLRVWVELVKMGSVLRRDIKMDMEIKNKQFPTLMNLIIKLKFLYLKDKLIRWKIWSKKN